MRLTLRTMLAYMDGILSGEDAEDIGRRIEESEPATALLHRIRDVMRRLRLAAPSLTDRRPGLDPNTVAEYLDNTLHESRVTDFEKVCLESDVHLAEVAACHQILTMVLGEAAEIDPAARQRMYALPSLHLAEAAAQPPSAAAGASSGDGETAPEAAGRKPREKPTVPDYLREPPRKRRLLLLAVALATVVCIALVVLGALGQFKAGTPLGNTLASLLARGQPDRHEQEQEAVNPSVEPPQPPAPSPAQAPAKHSEPGPPEQRRERPDEQTGAELPREPVPEPPKVEPEESPVGPEVKPVEEPNPTPPQESAKGPAGLMSEREEVLLRFNPQAAHWERVPQRGIVAAGETLLALPTYRPLLVLATPAVTIQLIGGTQAELLPADAAGVPGVKAEFGQLVMHTIGRPGARLRLQVGKRSGLITFAEAESVVALDVIPVHAPGTDPQGISPSVVTHLYARGGQILWDEGGGAKTLAIPVGHRATLSDQSPQPPVPVDGLPKWVAGEDMDSLEKGADRLASATLARELQVDRSLRFGASLVLMELGEHPRKENRWLAARCLGYVGDFGPLVSALNDPDYPPVWTDESIEYLRAAIARGPAAADRILEALTKKYGQDAPTLYRMLWGYTLAGIKDGRQAEQLVEYLNHETLAVRTLSFWNLRDIFGLTLQYRPTDREPIRRAHAQRWRQRLESGEMWAKLPRESGTGVAPKAAPPEPALDQP